MAEQIEISIKPIGIVRSEYKRPDQVPIPGKPAEVEVFSEYSPALLRIAENSHLWMLLWFHQADRRVLITVPRRIDPDLPEYGVFGMRSPNRPNPIALTLVKLESAEGNILKVNGMDGIDGTLVLDIKPYFENDIIFSPVTPFIRPVDRQMRREIFMKEVLNHHQEECAGAYTAVRMALVADEKLGRLTIPDVRLTVHGSPCLADALQALSRARLANPPRFRFKEDLNLDRSIWEKDGARLVITARQSLDQDSYKTLNDKEIFLIEMTNG